MRALIHTSNHMTAVRCFVVQKRGVSATAGLLLRASNEHWNDGPGLLPFAASRVRLFAVPGLYTGVRHMSGARPAHSEALLRDSQACNPMPSGATRI